MISNRSLFSLGDFWRFYGVFVELRFVLRYLFSYTSFATGYNWTGLLENSSDSLQITFASFSTSSKPSQLWSGSRNPARAKNARFNLFLASNVIRAWRGYISLTIWIASWLLTCTIDFSSLSHSAPAFPPSFERSPTWPQMFLKFFPCCVAMM